MAANHNSSHPAMAIRLRWAKRGTTISPIIIPEPNTANTGGIQDGGTWVTTSNVSAR